MVANDKTDAAQDVKRQYVQTHQDSGSGENSPQTTLAAASSQSYSSDSNIGGSSGEMGNGGDLAEEGGMQEEEERNKQIPSNDDASKAAPKKVEREEGHSSNMNSQEDKLKFDGIMAIILLLIYLALNVALNVFNKWLFTGPLKIPVFVTMTHQIACFIAAGICMIFPSFYTRAPIEGQAMFCKLLIIPFGFVLSIALNNVSLMFCSIAINQMIRSMSPVTVALVAYFVEGKRYSLANMDDDNDDGDDGDDGDDIDADGCNHMLLPILVNKEHSSHSLLWTSLGGCNFNGSHCSRDFEFIGVSLCLSSILGSTFQLVLTGFFLGGQRVVLQVLDILLYTSIPSIILLFPVSLMMGDLPMFVDAVEKIALIKYTSSVYFAVAGGFKTGVTIALSYLFFKQSTAPLSIAGIIITSMAFAAHSYVVYNEKRMTIRKKEIVSYMDTAEDDSEVAKPFLSSILKGHGAEKGTADSISQESV
eukprot:jgi/Bigna1/75741/fgenesh1_pg.36_\